MSGAAIFSRGFICEELLFNRTLSFVEQESQEQDDSNVDRFTLALIRGENLETCLQVVIRSQMKNNLYNMAIGSLSTNLLIYRTCYLLLGYSESNCSLLGNTDNNITQALEKLVEPDAQVIRTVQSTIMSIPMIIVCVCVGPWSDKFGRKPILLISQIGTIFSLLIMTLISAIPSISPWYFSISSVPAMVTGGVPAYLTVSLSYLTDTSTQETRGIRMAFFEGFMGVGMLVGNLSGSALFYVTNYETVFATASLLCAIGLIYTIYFIPESVENIEREGKLKGLFDSKNLMEMLRVAIKKRENSNRGKILLLALISIVVVFIFSGEGSLIFPYLREKLHWTLTMYNVFSSVNDVIWIVTCLFGIGFLHKVMKVRESVLICMGIISLLNGSVMRALATSTMVIYASTLARCLGGVTSPMIRSQMSKLVVKEEVGKLFSILMIGEFVFGLGAAPLFTYIYNSSINTQPGLFNFVAAGLYCFGLFLIGIVMVLEYRTPAHVYLGMENEEENEIEDIMN